MKYRRIKNHDCCRKRIARIIEHVVDALNPNESIVLVRYAGHETQSFRLIVFEKWKLCLEPLIAA